MSTSFLKFEELTWPEDRAVHRRTPLVLPLGSGYDMHRLADALGNPEIAYLLPSFPYGWQGSGLVVSDAVLSRYLENLISGLWDDGFTNTFVLVPQGLQLNLCVPWLALPHQSTVFQSNSLPAETEHGKLVLIPIGHTEQHGFHLPLSTDTMIIEAIAQGTASAFSEQTTLLPVMPYGVSTHRQSFAGTFNAGGRAFEDFWINVIDVLAERRFKLFYLINGHGGNSSFIINAIKYAGERHRRIFCATAWLYLSGPQGIAALEKYRQSGIGGMGHACELETSFILHLHPELVHMERVVDEVDFVATPSYYMDWVEGGALIANPPWDDDSKTGAYGAGSLATAEKGRLWLQAAIDEKVAHIKEIFQQHQLREARRESGYGLWGEVNKSGYT
ncbi:MAG: creatininase family protein [Anaerolineae bacterium]|nr:creatininase family protein [Anaerolineae bacterium]